MDQDERDSKYIPLLDHSERQTVRDSFFDVEVPKQSQMQVLQIISEMVKERGGLSIADRYNHSSVHVATFTGSALVNWMLRNEYLNDRTQAILFGRKLVDLGYIERSGKHKHFQDSYYAFYRFTIAKNPEKFESFLSKEEIARIINLNRREVSLLARFPASLFTIAMGTAGIGNIFFAIYKDFNTLNFIFNVGSLFAITASVMWSAFFLIYCLKVMFKFNDFMEEWSKVDRANFFCTISITGLLLADSALNVSTTLSMILWILSTILHCFLALALVSKWILAKLRVHEITPVFFLPVVGLTVVPITGAKLGYVDFGRLLFGMGFFYYVVTFAIFWHRILFKGMLVEKFVPRLFIAITPPSLMSISYALISGGTFSVTSELLFGVAIFTLIVVFVIRFTQTSIPFTLGWWAYVFPLAAFANASWAFFTAMSTSSHMAYMSTIILASIATGIACISWIYVALFTIWTLFRKRLIFPCIKRKVK